MSKTPILIFALSILSIALCFWIEYLNIKNDNFLPRNFEEMKGNQSWRQPIITDELSWRVFNYRRLREDYKTFKIPEKEKQKMYEIVTKNKSIVLLYSLVNQALFLYILLPIFLLICLTRLKIKDERKINTLSILLITLSYTYIFSRELFTAVMAG